MSLDLPIPFRADRLKQREEKKKNVVAARSLLQLFNQSREDEVHEIADTNMEPKGAAWECVETGSGCHVGLQTELSAHTIGAMESDYNEITVENME